MPISYGKSVTTLRREKLHEALGPERFRKMRWLRSFARFVLDYYLPITLAVLFVACVFTHIYYYNVLTRLEQQADNLQAQVGAGLQMRQNIVVSLAATVDRFITHEQGIFTSAMDTRADSMGISKDLNTLIQSVKEVSPDKISSAGLTRLMAVAENYPQLVSSQPYQVLIEKIGQTETEVYGKRIEYNNAVYDYNARLSTFPVNIAGKILRFRKQTYFAWDHKAEWVFESNHQDLNAETQE